MNEQLRNEIEKMRAKVLRCGNENILEGLKRKYHEDQGYILRLELQCREHMDSIEFLQTEIVKYKESSENITRMIQNTIDGKQEG